MFDGLKKIYRIFKSCDKILLDMSDNELGLKKQRGP